MVVSLCDYISAGESKSRAVKHIWTMYFYRPLSHHLLAVQMLWFHCRALVYNKMIIDSFICSPFFALLDFALSEVSMPTELQRITVACCIISYKATAQNYRDLQVPWILLFLPPGISQSSLTRRDLGLPSWYIESFKLDSPILQV